MNPFVNGMNPGSFTSSLMAISAPSEALKITHEPVQVDDLKDLFSDQENFSDLLAALRQVVPEETLEQIEALIADGNELPLAVAELSADSQSEATVLPLSIVLEVARQVEQAPVRPLPLPSQLQTVLPMQQPLTGTPAEAAPVPDPVQLQQAVPSVLSPQQPGTLPEVDLLARSAETDPLKLTGRMQALSETTGTSQQAAAAMIKTLESPLSLRSSAPTPMTLDQPLGGRGWEQGVGERILWMMGSSVQSASLRINPAHLGPIEIQVSMHHDQASVTFTAHHAPVREALEVSIPRLREMFLENNLQLANVDVGQRNQGEQQSMGSAAQHSREGFNQAEDGAAADLAEHDEAELQPTRQHTTDRVLDDYA